MIYCSTNNLRHPGGLLGNQVMRVMSLMGLAKKHNTTFAIPEWPYAKYFETEIPQQPPPPNLKKVQEIAFHYTPEFYDKIDWTNNIDLSGYFQSDKYWDDKLKFEGGYINWMLNKYNFVDNTTLAISVRRGDFVGNKNYFQIPLEYYTGALFQHFEGYKEGRIFLFSDDQDWCREQFKFLNNVYFIDAEPIEQLAVMTLCSNFILSNSTFSFMGGYLANRGKVIRPIRNFDGDLAKRNSERDYWPEAWIPFDHTKIYNDVDTIR